MAILLSSSFFTYNKEMSFPVVKTFYTKEIKAIPSERTLPEKKFFLLVKDRLPMGVSISSFLSQLLNFVLVIVCLCQFSSKQHSYRELSLGVQLN